MIAPQEQQTTGQMLGMKDVREMLQLSTREVINLVRTNRLRAYKYAGEPITIGRVSHQTTGLRFRYSDIERMLEASRIR